MCLSENCIWVSCIQPKLLRPLTAFENGLNWPRTKFKSSQSNLKYEYIFKKHSLRLFVGSNTSKQVRTFAFMA